jgi:hypothetical protein
MPANAISSTPYYRYKNLLLESRSEDTHGPYIKETKTGIILGASKKLAEGIIDNDQHSNILQIVENAQCSAFRPLLYIIRYDKAKHLLVYPSAKEKANPYSTEIRIEKLTEDMFDIEIFEDALR